MAALPHPAIDIGGAKPQATSEVIDINSIVVTVGLLQFLNVLKVQPDTGPISGGGGSDETVGYAS